MNTSVWAGGMDVVVQDTFTASEMQSLAATHGVTEAAVAHFFGTLRSRMRKYLTAVGGTSISSPGKFQQVRNPAAVATETAPPATAATAAVTAEVLAPLLRPGMAGGLRVGTSAALLQLMRRAKRIGERTLLLHAVRVPSRFVTRVWLGSYPVCLGHTSEAAHTVYRVRVACGCLMRANVFVLKVTQHRVARGGCFLSQLSQDGGSSGGVRSVTLTRAHDGWWVADNGHGGGGGKGGPAIDRVEGAGVWGGAAGADRMDAGGPRRSCHRWSRVFALLTSSIMASAWCAPRKRRCCMSSRGLARDLLAWHDSHPELHEDSHTVQPICQSGLLHAGRPKEGAHGCTYL